MQAWMIRAGRDSAVIDHFRAHSVVGLSWVDADITALGSKEEILALYEQSLPAAAPGRIRVLVGMSARFLFEVAVGDAVATYDSRSRSYLLGTIRGEPKHDTQGFGRSAAARMVEWTAEVERDALSISARNSLGAIQTLFRIPDDVWEELATKAGPIASPTSSTTDGPTGTGVEVGFGVGAARRDAEIEHADPDPIGDETDDDAEGSYDDMAARSRALVEDAIMRLSPDDMEELAAGILRAMGFRTQVSPKGPDLGKDVVASRDGLGLESPRVRVEVKHRRASMGAPQIRSFLSTLRNDDRGLIVSTGGFTKEARYEAERAERPVTLVDLEMLAGLVVEHYESFDVETRTLVPLRRLYWTADRVEEPIVQRVELQA